MKGWVKLHRQLNKNPIWFEEPFTKGQAWVDLVMNANHKDGRFFVRGIEIPILRGQIGWSEVTMSERWKWSRMKVRRYLKRLESDTQVIQQKMYKITSIITIINYEKYQGDTTDDTTDDTQTRMIKNDKELSEANASGINGKDMGWKSKPSDNDDDLPVVDMDSGEVVVQNNEKTELKELNEKIRHNLKLIEPLRGIAWGTGKDMNFHVKAYRELLKNGWSHEAIISAFVELVGTEHWKSEKEKGNFPGMNTVQFTLRNKQPK